MADTGRQRPEIGKFVDAACVKTDYLKAAEWPFSFNALLKRFLSRPER
jgi:hypothetical protein